MRNKNISPNAFKAFQNYKEELASEMGIAFEDNRKSISREKVEKVEEGFENLGRS